MKVATKVATGSGLLAALLIGVLAYFVVLVRQLAATSGELTAIHFRASTVALDLLDQLDQLEVNARKFFVTRDEAYADRVSQARDAFAAGLAELTSLDARIGGSLGTTRLGSLWSSFALAGVVRPEMAKRLEGMPDTDVLRVLGDPIERLRRETWAVLDRSREGIAARAAGAAEAGRAAQRVSLAVAGLALLLAALIVLLTVRSINEPLGRLIAGTRAVAGGTFATRIETGGHDEFADLAEDFNAMVRRLGELDEMKRGFVSRVSHELKTPLVAMQETNRLLLDELGGPLTDRQRRLLELNLQASRRLSAMIANLLDLARLEAGAMKYDIRPHDLAALARAAASELEVWAHERRVRFELEPPDAPVVVACDADRTVQLLVNLLDNAVKFSPEGGPVSVTVRETSVAPDRMPDEAAAMLGTARGGPFAVVRVADCGPGVPDSDKSSVFERFHQAHPGTRRAGAGVGLGLAICREVVRAHGGAVWVSDNHPSGSVFFVLLPLPPRRGGAGATPRAPIQETAT